MLGGTHNPPRCLLADFRNDLVKNLVPNQHFLARQTSMHHSIGQQHLFNSYTRCMHFFIHGRNQQYSWGIYYISLTVSIMGDPNISASNATSVFDNISLYHLPSLSFGGDILCSSNSSGILHGNLYLHQLHSKLFGEYVYHSCTARVHNQTTLSYGNMSCTTKLRLSMGSR